MTPESLIPQWFMDTVGDLMVISMCGVMLSLLAALLYCIVQAFRDI